MLVLRCTQKLLRRAGPPVADPPESTTASGDWYAQPLAGLTATIVSLLAPGGLFGPQQQLRRLASGA